jgi:hypothetical protein
LAAAGIEAGVGSVLSGPIAEAVGATPDAQGQIPAANEYVSVALTGAAKLLAGGAAESLIAGTDFGQGLQEELPNVIGQTIGNLVAGNEEQASQQQSQNGGSNPLQALFSGIEHVGSAIVGGVEQIGGAIVNGVEGAFSGDNSGGDTATPTGSAPADSTTVDEVVVTAKRLGNSNNNGAISITGSWTASQFTDWVKSVNKGGGITPSMNNSTGTVAKTFNSNADVAAAEAKVPKDTGGADTVENPALNAFMLSISPSLESLNIAGVQAEKFITIGQDSSGNYVVTSLQVLGSNGGSLNISGDTVAIAHTHLADENQEPADGDNNFLIATGKPSYEVSQGNNSVFEIERHQGVAQIRQIQSTTKFGPWEPFQVNPSNYRIYNDGR